MTHTPPASPARTEPSAMDPVLWDEACRIYGFVSGVDPVSLAPQQREIIDRAYAALDRFRAAEREWRPIETAPKDGTLIVLWWSYWRSIPVIGQFKANWDDGYDEQSGWRSEMVNDSRPVGAKGPIKWMPLPEPSSHDR